MKHTFGVGSGSRMDDFRHLLHRRGPNRGWVRFRHALERSARLTKVCAAEVTTATRGHRGTPAQGLWSERLMRASIAELARRGRADRPRWHGRRPAVRLNVRLVDVDLGRPRPLRMFGVPPGGTASQSDSWPSPPRQTETRSQRLALSDQAGRGFFQDLTLPPQHPILSAQARQLLPLAGRQTILTTPIDIVLVKPATKTALRDPKAQRRLTDRTLPFAGLRQPPSSHGSAVATAHQAAPVVWRYDT